MLIGGHMDSVPNGGWLDGCLNVLAGVEVLRRIAEEGEPPVTVRLVDWADEEGARFGRSLFGSSAARGLDARPGRAARSSSTATASRCPTRCRRTASTSTGRPRRARSSRTRGAYLELHIEQGPVLESLDLPLGVVLGTFGVERSRITWRGQAAHAGSTPMDKRRDALAGAAKLALDIREIAAEVGRRRRVHLGRRRLQAGHRHLGRRDRRAAARPAPPRRGEARADARSWRSDGVGALRAPRRTSRSSGSGSGSIEPILFDDALIELADESIREVAGTSHRLPSGPLHDAAEVARAGVPTVMLFVQSLRGLSHTPLEDTKPEHLELSVQALDRLASKTIERRRRGILTRPKEPLAGRLARAGTLARWRELIYRDEVVQLLFSVSDIVAVARRIEACSEEVTMVKRKLTKADLERSRADEGTPTDCASSPRGAGRARPQEAEAAERS